MQKQAQAIYCPTRQVDVDLAQEFRQCVLENQCFSDAPCPLQQKFQAIPAPDQRAAPDPTK